MNFRTKDLMVTVLPKGTAAANLGAVCRFPTITVCAHRCSLLPTPITCWRFCSFQPTCWLQCSYQITDITIACRLGTLPDITDTITPVCGGSMTPEIQPGVEIQDLGALREQLQAQLKALDEAEAAQAAGPATLAEAETLEAHLKDALSQVQARKAELKGAKK